MKLRILFVLLISSFSSVSFSQNTIKGIVLDASNNSALGGATITYSGKGGTTSDAKGMFAIPCEKITHITISFIGYETSQQTIKNCNEDVRVMLTPLTNSLNVVEISATSGQNKSILYQPASITKLNEVELKRSTGLFLDDAINNNVPGVIMQRRAISSGQQINIRGYGNGVRGTNGLNSNFDIQGIKVYLNGIPITDAEGITVLDDIDFASIGNVEVTKGPAGTLYGLAIAGAVNLRTLRPVKGKTSIGQDVFVGSYGLRRYTTQFQMGGDRSSLLINYGHQSYDGFMIHTASHKDFVNIAGDFQPSDKQSISTYFGYSNSHDERNGELDTAQYRKLDYTGNPAYIKNNAHSQVISFRAGLGHSYIFNSHFSNTTNVFATGVTNNSSSAGGWTDKDPINYGLRSTLNTKFTLGKGFILSGVTGVEMQEQRAQTIGYAMVADSNNLAGYNRIGATRSNQFSISATTLVFTEWTASLPHDILITAGVGVSNMKIELNDRFYVASTNRFATKYSRSYDGMYSPHFAINKVFSNHASIYASYSRAYKAPVSSYFYIPLTGQLNRNLKPEIGDQLEVGTKGSLLNEKLSYEVALFRAVFSDKMTVVPVAAGSTTLYSYVTNGGKQNHKGIEALVKYAVYESLHGAFRAITPFANITYSDFQYKDFKFQTLNATQKDYSGNAVAGVPPYTANIGVDAAAAFGIYANAVYSYRDAMPITSAGDVSTTSYNLINAKIGIKHSLSKHFNFDAYFGVNNITNTQYPAMVFINQLPDAYLPAALKANYFGGLNLKYNF